MIRKRLKSLSDALLAFSLANLCFIRTRYGLFFQEQFLYYKQLPLNRPALAALALNLIVSGFIGWRLIRWIRGAHSYFVDAVAALVACGLLLLPIDFLRTFYFHMKGSEAVALTTRPFLVAGVVILLAIVLRWPRRALHAFAAVLLIVSPSVVLTFGKIAYYSVRANPDSQPASPPLHENPQVATEPRVIWILYDELDQRVAFSQRPKDCPLPEFDRLCAESLQATNAFPPGSSTTYSLPALITGRYVVSAGPQSRNELSITYAGENAPVGWSTQTNVFSRAQELGFNTGLVGWYHPYSRLFGSSLNFCAWYPYPPYQQSRDRTVMSSMMNQIWSLISPLQQRRLQIDLYQKSLANSRDLVKDRRYGLVFLHLPGPHYPSIYNPAKRVFTLKDFSRVRGYFHNLQLTDVTMGILRRDMEQAGEWDRVWLIISSDHWWRDSRQYDGILDYHVPFIIKAPGKNAPMIYSETVNTVVTKDLALAILQKEVSTIPEAVAWLDAHKAPPPPSYAIMR